MTASREKNTIIAYCLRWDLEGVEGVMDGGCSLSPTPASAAVYAEINAGPDYGFAEWPLGHLNGNKITVVPVAIPAVGPRARALAEDFVVRINDKKDMRDLEVVGEPIPLSGIRRRRPVRRMIGEIRAQREATCGNYSPSYLALQRRGLAL